MGQRFRESESIRTATTLGEYKPLTHLGNCPCIPLGKTVPIQALRSVTLHMVVSVKGFGPSARSAAEGWQTEPLWDGFWGELSLRRGTERLCAHPKVWHESDLSAVLATPPRQRQDLRYWERRWR